MKVVEAKNLAEFYCEMAHKYGAKVPFLTRQGSSFHGPSYKELYERGTHLATALIELGIQAQEHVAILADNRLEWMLSDYGIQLCGAVNTPRGTDVTEFDMSYILSHANVRLAFVEDERMQERLIKLQAKLPDLKHIVLMAPGSSTGSKKGKIAIHTLPQLEEQGRALRASGDKRMEERISKIKEDDLFTLIYTSGTTGEPKGVMLTHANTISQINYVPLALNSEDSALSILPVWHIFERQFELLCMSKGISTYYTNLRNIREDMQQVRPTCMGSAPRLWESIYLGIKKKVEGGPAVARALFQAAYFCASHFKAALRFLKGHELDLNGRNPVVSFCLRGPLQVARALCFFLPFLLLDFVVLRKVRKATGGRMRYSISGGGALALHLDLFFNNIGLRILEGYGMTETCPVIAVRTPASLVIGSVGEIWPHTELRLVDIKSGEIIDPKKRGVKGEIHVKGPQVMKGYYNNPKATQAVLKDSWMNTGDLGIMTYNNTLKIVGRSKETIVLQSGENVEPVPIENMLLQSELVEHCMVTGQDQKFLTCLIVPNIESETLQAFGKDHASIASRPEAYEIVLKEIKRITSSANGFKSFEKVIDCRLLAKPFVAGEELTNIFKLKRHVITEKYQDLIHSMYS